MTSHLVSAFKHREDAQHTHQVLKNIRADGCVFCAIVQGHMPAFKVYEDDKAIAFLDILPIRRGHLLIIPKDHYPRMTDLPKELSAHMASILPMICRALCRATGQPDFNIVNNNGYAQVVHHVHWHVRKQDDPLTKELLIDHVHFNTRWFQLPSLANRKMLAKLLPPKPTMVSECPKFLYGTNWTMRMQKSYLLISEKLSRKTLARQDTVAYDCIAKWQFNDN